MCWARNGSPGSRIDGRNRPSRLRYGVGIAPTYPNMSIGTASVTSPLMPEIPPFPEDRHESSRALEQLGARLPGLLGIELLAISDGASKMRMEIAEKHLASNGYLHAASVVALADTTAGYGCVASLPAGAIGSPRSSSNRTTWELSSMVLSWLRDPGARRTDHPGLGRRGECRGVFKEDRTSAAPK